MVVVPNFASLIVTLSSLWLPEIFCSASAIAFSKSSTDTFFKGDVMNESVLTGLNQVAEIFARAPLSAEAADLYRRATGIADDEQFLKRLATLVKGSKKFPVPADFGLDRQASEPSRQLSLLPGESITFACGTTVTASPVMDNSARERLAIFLEKAPGVAPHHTLEVSPAAQEQGHA